jgi:glutathione synthase/RimK-type ligase-like ATP-grasp enzyme
MKIAYSKKSRITARLLKEMMPESLINAKIILNLGNSKLDTSRYQDWLIINKSESISNSANKKRMFELFQQSNIKCLEYRQSISRVIFFRSVWFKRKWGWTRRENKVKEYRVIVFLNKIFKIYEKIPNNQIDFQWKKDNTIFTRRRMQFPEDVKLNIINSVKCIGLDLAGVDVLLNDLGEYKVIEVNSGLGMGEPTIRKLYRRISRIYRNL